jgi:hypothetical protein
MICNPLFYLVYMYGRTLSLCGELPVTAETAQEGYNLTGIK